MTTQYNLYIANKRYSSWSMRPWVLLSALQIPFTETQHIFVPGQHQPAFTSFSPSGKVPCLHDPSTSAIIWDSLAITEYLYETHPQIWPAEKLARAFARCAAAEMHSGFHALRNECSMNVGLRIAMILPLSRELQRDLKRLGELFTQGLTQFGGPWLAGGEFTAVDAMFAPVASRCRTYGLELEGEKAREYLGRLFEHEAVQKWVREGIRETARDEGHEVDCIRDRKVLEDLTIQ